MNRKRWLLPAGLIALTGGFLVVVVRPQWQRMQILKAEVATERTRCIERDQQAAGIARLEAELRGLRAKVGDFDQRIPVQGGMDSFLKDVARLADNRGVRTVEAVPDRPTDLTDVRVLPVTLRLHGRLSEVCALLRDMRGLPRIARFDGFKAQANPGAAGEVDAQLGLAVFCRS